MMKIDCRSMAAQRRSNIEERDALW